MGYTKKDVTFHSDGYGSGFPAVNVKVYKDITADVVAEVAREHEAEGLTLEWVEEQLEQDAEGWFWLACESEGEYLTDYVAEILEDYNIKVWFQGRQSGWMVVDGLPELEHWDAVLLAKWRKVERVAREIADDIPRQMVSLLVLNVWEPEQEGKAEDADARAIEGVPASA